MSAVCPTCAQAIGRRRTFYLIARKHGENTEYLTVRYATRQDFTGIPDWTFDQSKANWYDSREAAEDIVYAGGLGDVALRVVPYTVD